MNHLDQQVEREKFVASIIRNLGCFNWKINKMSLGFKETLNYVLAWSILVYIGTLIVVAGLLKMEKFNACMEVQLFKMVNGLLNSNSNKTIEWFT